MDDGQIHLLGHVGPSWIPFFVYGGFAIAAGVADLALPETRGKPLPETIEDALLAADMFPLPPPLSRERGGKRWACFSQKLKKKNASQARGLLELSATTQSMLTTNGDALL